MNRQYLIFTTPNSIDDESTGYLSSINWAFTNLSNPNVLVLSEDDIHFIQYQTSILDIINEENESMIQQWEDDLIHSHETKLAIRKQLIEYQTAVCCNRENEFINSLLRLLDISIENKKYLYFFW